MRCSCWYYWGTIGAKSYARLMRKKGSAAPAGRMNLDFVSECSWQRNQKSRCFTEKRQNLKERKRFRTSWKEFTDPFGVLGCNRLLHPGGKYETTLLLAGRLFLPRHGSQSEGTLHPG